MSFAFYTHFPVQPDIFGNFWNLLVSFEFVMADPLCAISGIKKAEVNKYYQ